MERKKEESVSWIAPAAEAGPGEATLSAALIKILKAVGVRDAFGIVGGGNIPFAEALKKNGINVRHTRHEGGASFAATEAHFAGGSPVAVFVTTGPGILNTLVGICAARWDGAKIVLISGSTNPEKRGCWAVQETSSYTFPIGDLFAPGSIFDFSVQILHEKELFQVARRLQAGFSRPQGYVAHISLPLAVQTKLVSGRFDCTSTVTEHSGCDPQAVEAVLSRIHGRPFALWLGFGARNAAGEIRRLVDRTGAAVMCTPRAKGVFPEDHPNYVGVTGAGGHESAVRYMQARKPAYTLVLGTKLGEASSFWDARLLPQKEMIHVDIDRFVPGVAYPETPVLAVQAEIRGFLKSLLDALPHDAADPVEAIECLDAPQRLEARTRGNVRPQYLMQSIQRRVIDTGDTVVMSEAGNAMSWANHYLRFPAPGRYRTSAAYGSMGHFVTGVVGASLIGGKKALAIVGDGAMLMNSEISTAVKYGAQAVWVVLNDSQYGITEAGMRVWGFEPVETDIPETDFVQISRAMGGAGIRVEQEAALEAALDQAMECTKPCVVDVIIDRREISPVVKTRIGSLKEQETGKAGSL